MVNSSQSRRVARIVVAALICLRAVVPTLAAAQENPVPIDQFLNAFHGKPVAPIAPIPTAANTAQQSSLAAVPTNRSTTVDGPSSTAVNLPISCPPGVDRIGCPGSTAAPPRTECPAGMTTGPTGCVPMAMPANAHRVSSDGQWQCNDGYLRYGSICMPMGTPGNAHIASNGVGWECNTGYRRMGSVCVAINLPPNAHLEATYSGWSCDSGYKQVGNWCVAEANNN